jgi:hypothetical protein
MLSRLAISGNIWGSSTSSDVVAVHNYSPKKKRTVFRKKCTVVWPSVGMIIPSNGRSQQTPSAKGGKGKIQWLDRVSCPDMEIQVLPNLRITVDWVSCPDRNIGVLTTRFLGVSCFKETHVFCSRNMGVHVQCACAKKLVSSYFAKIMHNYVRKKNMLSRLAISGNVWGGSTSSDVSAVYNYNPKKKKFTVFQRYQLVTFKNTH